MNRRASHRPWRYSPYHLGLAVLGLLAAITLFVAPYSGSMVEQWSRAEVESRSRLVYESTQASISRAVATGDTPRLIGILEGVARDDHILAVGLCGEGGSLHAFTGQLPRAFSCDQAVNSESESFSSMRSNRKRVLVASFPITLPEGRAYLVVFHDLSYIDARSGRVRTYVVAAVVGVAILAALVGFFFILAFVRGWMDALRRAVEDVRAGRATTAPNGDRSSMAQEIQKLLKNLDSGRTPTEAPEKEWTPESLEELLAEALPQAEVIVLANREPYIHNRTDDGIVLQTPASGVVSALEPVMRACRGTWIAHGSGTADRETVDSNDHLAVPPDDPSYTLRRLWITEDEQDGYYYGFANEGLWPLCHIAFVRPIFRDGDWQMYREINARFAEAVVQEARTEDPIVLVQDYHFALAPRMIRERLPNATIITFWHIPWPNAETFGICPWKEEILAGLLGSSVLGFHTQFHCNNFLETVDRFVESRIDREHATVTLGGHEAMVRPYPISIEWPPKGLEGQRPVEVCRARVREALGLAPDAKLAVGIERFDYTKGILDRMRSIDLLLTLMPEWRGKFTFVQVAAPTRSKLASYRSLQDEAVALAEEINARHGEGGYQPIRLIVRHHEPAEVFELFRAADLCIVSSLHDGMNLVAKEFVASREDEEGVLILSSFTGASRELSEALIVNPYDEREMATALDTALRMPAQQQRERMRLMRQQVREQNVYRWAGRMLIDAARIRQKQRILAFEDAPAPQRRRVRS
ncbi:trehalose-6-phosphate synthase [Sphingomonas sp. dw_22]|uniref:alpha,alpha-trehalose-phosphate synthase (UDP-forming) n=1 Tax=Sphingomonas sp. dw_22 TaxID=2721175 RepID=UPI001BD1BDF5|nr:trehalose-6-phosphate synthase [Sphingomonas sp. dw_22]